MEIIHFNQRNLAKRWDVSEATHLNAGEPRGSAPNIWNSAVACSTVLSISKSMNAHASCRPPARPSPF